MLDLFKIDWKALAIKMLVLLAWTVAVASFTYKYTNTNCTTKELTTVVESYKHDEKTKQEVIQLDNDALVREYCHWVYDLPYNECIKQIVPIE